MELTDYQYQKIQSIIRSFHAKCDPFMHEYQRIYKSSATQKITVDKSTNKVSFETIWTNQEGKNICDKIMNIYEIEAIRVEEEIKKLLHKEI